MYAFDTPFSGNVRDCLEMYAFFKKGPFILILRVFTRNFYITAFFIHAIFIYAYIRVYPFCSLNAPGTPEAALPGGTGALARVFFLFFSLGLFLLFFFF